MYQNRSLVRENRKVALFSDAEMAEIKEAEPNLPAQVATLNSKSEWLDFEIEPEKLRDFFEEEIHA